MAGRRGSDQVGDLLYLACCSRGAVVVESGAYACRSLATDGLPIAAGRRPRPGMWHEPGPASWNLAPVHEALVVAMHGLSLHLAETGRLRQKDRFESYSILGLPASFRVVGHAPFS